MEEARPDWKSLPVEVLQNILEIAAKGNSPGKICKFALVCRAWLHPMQFIVYSNVFICNLQQLQKFLNTVERNTTLGKTVKFFSINNNLISMYAEDEKANEEKMISLATTLLLTYLIGIEEISGHNLDIYNPILNALLGSQLKGLKKLRAPYEKAKKSEIENYVKCILLLKDRIQNVEIFNDDRHFDDERTIQLPFYRLYNDLHQFDNLKKLYVKRETHEDIQALEYVIETCKSLEELTIYFKPSDSNANLIQNDSITNDAILKFNPNSSIKVLTGYVYVSNNYKNLAYIMHKFPQLCELDLGMMRGSPKRLDQNMLTQLLYYLIPIKYYYIRRLTVDPVVSTETLGSYWHAKSKTESEFVEFDYLTWYKEYQQDEVHVVKGSKSRDAYIRLMYPILDLEDIEWIHMDFIEKNGLYILQLLFTLNMTFFSMPDNCELPENFIAHTLSFCPNLENLILSRCILKQAPYTTVDLNKTFSIVELHITNCTLYAGMLEQVSLILREIKQLRLGVIRYCTVDESQRSSESDTKIDIMMPSTRIEEIVIERFRGQRFI